MRKFLIFLLALLLVSCASEKKPSEEILAFLPEDSAVILRLQDADLFFSDIRNNELLRQNKNYPLWKWLDDNFSILELFPHQNTSYITFSYTNNKNPDFLYLIDGLPKERPLDSIKNRKVETVSSNSYQFKKYTLDGKVTYTAVQDSLFLLSNSRQLLEKSLSSANSFSSTTSFQKALKAASAEKPSFFINHQYIQPLLKEKISKEWLSTAQNFSNWTVLDAYFYPSSIKLNGISIAQDSVPRLLSVFKGVGLSPNNLASITPVKSDGFYSIGYKNFSQLQKNLKTLKGSKDSVDIAGTKNELFETSAESGLVFLPQGKVFVIRSLDPEDARLSFPADPILIEEFHEYGIYKLPEEKMFASLDPLIGIGDISAYSIVDNFLLFSASIDALKEVISSYQNGSVLSESEAYKTATENLSSESSLLLVANNRNFKNILSQNVSEEFTEATKNLNFENFPIGALQFVYQDGFAHVHAIISKATIEAEDATSQAAAVKLGSDLATKPVFFKNHRSNGMDIAVQDIQNNLYLISPAGKVYWKKQLDSRILGDIQSVDIFRNGRIQLAFATQSQLHIIDREGNNVKPFPLKFQDPITQALAVFDYDNNRDYRFVVVQNREVLMYDRRGNRVKGFRFSKADAPITQTPKHLRLGRKDYILIPESSGNLNILSRTGQQRVPVKENLNFSENNWYEYQGDFLSANANGEILKINEQGKIKKEDLDFSENVKVSATEKTFVSLSENQLRIKETVVDLDYGLYTAPQIFLINNKTYVSVTDLQAHKVFLFDTKAELLPGFPVYGNSPIDLENIDKDAALELVVKGDDDGILIYEIQ